MSSHSLQYFLVDITQVIFLECHFALSTFHFYIQQTLNTLVTLTKLQTNDCLPGKLVVNCQKKLKFENIMKNK